MGNRKLTGIIIAINLISLGVLILNLVELYNLLFGTTNYPFGSEFFAEYSIYRSKVIYVSYIIMTLITLAALIISSMKRQWLLYGILFILSIFLTLYPIITNE
jgi:hypothetical protein